MEAVKQDIQPIIEIKDVCKEFDGVSVIENINLYIRKGEFVTFLGPSGCGKTTTLRMIAGFDLPTSGQILLNGKDISVLPPNKRPVNTVFQKYALFPHLNIFENVAFGLKLKRIEKKYVDKNGKEKVKYEKLSKKEKRKVDLTRRTQWSDYGCLCPATRIVPDKKKEQARRLCKGKPSCY